MAKSDWGDSWDAFQAVAPSAGKLGFLFQPTTFDTETPFAVTVLRAENLRVNAWTINLAAWRGAKQTGELGLAQLKARVTWGGGDAGGNATETVLVDYPAAGTTFGIHGSTVLVELVGSTSAGFVSDIPPLLSGWLSMGRANGRQLEATLTLPDLDSFIANGGEGVVVRVPARARAYRMLNQGSDEVALEGAQLSGNATPITVGFDNLANLSTELNRHPNLASNRSAWFPIAPEAQTIVISNLSDEDETQFRVQFLLELG